MPPSSSDQTRLERDGAFPTTRWSLIVQLRDSDEGLSSVALEEICGRYWYPIYAFLRSRGNAPADAEDLTQAFFERLLDRDSLGDADPERGKLRTFLLSVLGQVTADDLRRRSAQKRGGDVTVVSFDATVAEERYEHEVVAGKAAPDPTSLFDRVWAMEVLERAWGSLRVFYENKNRTKLLVALEPFVGWHEADGDYGTIAEGFGLKESAIRLHVHRMRKRLRGYLEDEVLQTLADPADLDGEMRHLLMLAGNS